MANGYHKFFEKMARASLFGYRYRFLYLFAPLTKLISLLLLKIQNDKRERMICLKIFFDVRLSLQISVPFIHCEFISYVYIVLNDSRTNPLRY